MCIHNLIVDDIDLIIYIYVYIYICITKNSENKV